MQSKQVTVNTRDKLSWRLAHWLRNLHQVCSGAFGARSLWPADFLLGAKSRYSRCAQPRGDVQSAALSVNRASLASRSGKSHTSSACHSRASTRVGAAPNQGIFRAKYGSVHILDLDALHPAVFQIP